jgi:hypothetical protein
VTITQGWDSHAWIEGPWIHRSPRRAEVRPRLLAEATLLPWPLIGAPVAVADGVAETYEPTPELRERALDWCRLAPWYGVHRGLLLDIPEDVDSGLSELLAWL